MKRGIGAPPYGRLLDSILQAARALLAGVVLGFSLTGCAAPGSVDRFTWSLPAKSARAVTSDGILDGIGSDGGKAWLGIPYARPPLGPWRWRAPQPPEPWAGVRDAKHLRRDCVQNLSPGSLLGRPGGLFVRGSEDCLVLNVYAPSNAEAGQHWPVMVWLHGGGFSAGTAANYDPSDLVQRQGVIVVTLNYRLGALGFLAHPALSSEDAAAGSGDYGLLDQQAALRWVSRNIQAFGGDPARVTLFGESAGGFSVCHQLTSPGAAGLFAAAIIQSGACTARAQNEPLAEAHTAGESLAKDLGCDRMIDKAACLRAASAHRVARAVSHRLGALGPNSWGAVTGTPVLPLPAPEAFRQGAFTHVPVMLGVNHDEGRLFALLQMANGRLWSRASYRRLLQHDYDAAAGTLEARYPASTYGSPASAYAALITDEVFACPARSLARALAPATPTWVYAFDDPHAATVIPHIPGTPPLGASHATEITYILHRPWIMADPQAFSPAQQALADRMQSAWGAFARTGSPAVQGADPWPPYPAVHIFAPDGMAPARERDASC